MTNNRYTFTALRGQQGNQTCYLAQCPIKLAVRLFIFDEAEVPEKLRLQHTLEDGKIASLAKYFSNHPADYVLGPFVVAVDETPGFEPLPKQSDVGQLHFSLKARFLVHDGQHRRAALESILRNNPEMGLDTLAVLFLPDENFARSPRLFAELNNAQSQKNLSRRVLADSDNELAELVRELAETAPIFKGRTEFHKTTISNRSTALFTLSAIYQATQALLQNSKRAPLTNAQKKSALEFWTRLGETLPEWQQVIAGELKPAELRQTYITAHSITLVAIGRIGGFLLTAYPEHWQKRLTAFANLNWKRSNQLWEGRAMIGGKMNKAHASIILTGNVLKQALKLRLTPEEQKLETRIAKSN